MSDGGSANYRDIRAIFQSIFRTIFQPISSRYSDARAVRENRAWRRFWHGYARPFRHMPKTFVQRDCARWMLHIMTRCFSYPQRRLFYPLRSPIRAEAVAAYAFTPYPGESRTETISDVFSAAVRKTPETVCQRDRAGWKVRRNSRCFAGFFGEAGARSRRDAPPLLIPLPLPRSGESRVGTVFEGLWNRREKRAKTVVRNDSPGRDTPMAERISGKVIHMVIHKCG